MSRALFMLVRAPSTGMARGEKTYGLGAGSDGPSAAAKATPGEAGTAHSTAHSAAPTAGIVRRLRSRPITCHPSP
ncbi:hypothetical protein ACWGII_43315 [Streptomyces sp. NPDC054855]